MKSVTALKAILRAFSWAAVGVAAVAVAAAQAPAGGAGQRGAAPGGAGRGGPARPVLSVTSTGFPDGGEVPMHHAGRGDNKSPAFDFHWSLGPTPAAAPDTLQTYAVIFHDIRPGR